MKPIVLTAAPSEDIARRWRSFTSGERYATHYVTPEYFVDPYVTGERFAVLVEDSTESIVAVATGVVEGGRAIAGMFSRPQLIVDRTNAHAAFDSLRHGIEALGAHSAELYSFAPIDQPAGTFECRTSGDETSVVMLDLASGPDALFAQFSQTRRNEIRKAERLAIVEVKECETDDELNQLYAIYCDWNIRKGHKPGSIEQMTAAISQTANRRTLIAKVGSEVAAGSFFRFAPSGVVEYAANFSMPKFQRLRPNDLIGWHAIKWACGEGFSLFSMGGSHLFLRRFGGEVVQTYCYRSAASAFSVDALKESAKEIGLDFYRRLPSGMREGVKSIFTR